MLREREILTLLALPGVAQATVRQLLQSDSSNDESLIERLERARQHIPRIRVPSQSVLIHAEEQADQQLAAAADADIHVLPWTDPAFPDQLKAIPEYPVVLFVRGSLEILRRPAVAVVGTRTPSERARFVAEAFGRALAEHGFVVVSGLALGCDTAAHLGCLAATGQTIAVLAHGLDRVYPAANHSLAERILEHGGSLLSEYPSGTAPQKRTFVERDRIQSGLSQAVVIVETAADGGTMHTAAACLAQQRQLLCVADPELLAQAQASGNEQLLRSKAGRAIAGPDELTTLIGGQPDPAGASSLKQSPDPSQLTFNW